MSHTSKPIFWLSEKLPLLLLLLMLCLFSGLSTSLSACAMSALIAKQGYTLDDFPPQGLASEFWAYNDPWDYFGFVMANSTQYSNADGYGIVAYRDGDPSLSPRGMWYKRIYDLEDFGSVYYTGHYLDSDPTNTDWEHDVFDEALFTVMSGEDHPAIVLCHARFASGITYGNHPFWFQYRDRTFTFMHNGNVNTARTFMIERIHELNPGGEWFIQHPSNNFAQTDPTLWVDTEVFFHYLMSYIIASRGNVVQGLNNALAGLRIYLENNHSGVYNFIMSDGSSLYAFRSTPQNSSYKLSYREFRDQFCAIRTQAPLPGDTVLRQHELVVLSRDAKPAHYPKIILEDLAAHGPLLGRPVSRSRPQDQVPVLTADPNPFSGSTTLRLNVPSPANLVYTIYNLKGEVIWNHHQEVSAPGVVSTTWNGTDNQAQPVSAGVYLLRVSAGSQTYTKRVVLLK